LIDKACLFTGRIGKDFEKGIEMRMSSDSRQVFIDEVQSGLARMQGILNSLN
jgi:hypothetical protein